MKKGYCYLIENRTEKGALTNTYVGDCCEGTMGFNVIYSKAYKFYDEKSAKVFLEYINENRIKSPFEKGTLEVTEHEEV